MASESNSPMGERQLWSSWADKQGLEYLDIRKSDKSDDEDASTTCEDKKNKKCAASMRLPRKDMSLFGIRPGFEDCILVVCALCKLLVKKQSLIYHRINHHKCEAYGSDDGNTDHLSKHNVPNSSASNSSLSSQSAMNVVKPSSKSSNDNSHNGSSASSSSNSSPKSQNNAKRETNASNNYFYETCDFNGNSYNAIPNSNVKQEPLLSQPMGNAVRNGLLTDVLSSSQNVNSNRKFLPRDFLKTKQKGCLTSEPFTKRKPRPCKDFNPDEHCGVLLKSGKNCTKSLLNFCRHHPESMRKVVPGRSKPLSELMQLLLSEKKHKSGVPMKCLLNEKSQGQCTTTVPASKVLYPVATAKDAYSGTDSKKSFDMRMGNLEKLPVKSYTQKVSSPSHQKQVPANDLTYNYFYVKEEQPSSPVESDSTQIISSSTLELTITTIPPTSTVTTVSDTLSVSVSAPVVVAVSSCADTTVTSTNQATLTADNNDQVMNLEGIIQGLPDVEDFSKYNMFLRNSKTRAQNGKIASISSKAPPVECNYPVPVEICTFGLRQVEKRVFAVGRRFDSIYNSVKDLCNSLTSKQMESQPSEKACEESASPVSNESEDSSIPCSSQTSSVSTVTTTTTPHTTANNETIEDVSVKPHIATSCIAVPMSSSGLQPKKLDSKPKKEQVYSGKIDNRSCSKRKRTRDAEVHKLSSVPNSSLHATSHTGMPPTISKNFVPNLYCDPSLYQIIPNSLLLSNENARKGQVPNAHVFPTLQTGIQTGLNLSLFPNVYQGSNRFSSSYCGNSHSIDSLMSTTSSHSALSNCEESSQFNIHVLHEYNVLHENPNFISNAVPSQSCVTGQNPALHVGSIAEYPHICHSPECCINPKSISSSGTSSISSCLQCNADIESTSNTTSGQKENEQFTTQPSPDLPNQASVNSSHNSAFQLSLSLKKTEHKGNTALTLSKLRGDQPTAGFKTLFNPLPGDIQCRPKRLLPKETQATLPLKMPRLMTNSCQLLQLPSDILRKNGISNSDTSISFH